MSEMRISGPSSSSYSTYSSSPYSAPEPTWGALTTEVLLLLLAGTTGGELLERLSRADDNELRTLKSDLDKALGLCGSNPELRPRIVTMKATADAAIGACRKAKAEQARQQAAAEQARQAEARRLAEVRRQAEEAARREAEEAARREAQARQAEARRLAEARRQAEKAAQREAAEAERRERAAAAERAAAEEAVRAAAVLAAPSAKAHWYYCLDGEHILGPVTSSQMRELIAAGELTPEHLVSPDGTKWKRASRLQGAPWPGQPAD